MKRKIPWRAIPGLLLVLWGLIGLYSGPELSQYVFLPKEQEQDIPALLARAEEKWEGSFPAAALHGTAEGVSLTAGSRSQGEITLYETAGGYAEVYPRRFTAGRPLTRGDAGARVIVLDEQLAFLLFGGDRDPLDQPVTLGEKEYRVVGVAAHRRRIGESGSYTAWIPWGAEGAPKAEVLTLSAGGRTGASLRTLFESTAREVFGEGQAFFLGKERTRGTMLLRVVVILAALRLLMLWIRWVRIRLAARYRELREEMKTRYPRQMAGKLALRGLEAALMLAVTVGAGALLAVWAAGPMRVFPEWVPESPVDPAALGKRFRELTGAAARPLQFRTPEMAEIRFWSGMIRWGTVLALLGALPGGGRRGAKTTVSEAAEAAEPAGKTGNPPAGGAAAETVEERKDRHAV